MPTQNQGRRQFGQRLKELRTARGLTQEALCEEVEVSLESISRLERGRIYPSLPTLLRLADALNVGVDELLRGAAHQPKRHSPGVERVIRLLDGLEDEALEGLALLLKHLPRKVSRSSARSR